MGMKFRLLVWCFQIIIVLGWRVEFLPGFDGPLPFYLETGLGVLGNSLSSGLSLIRYVGVDEGEEAQIFYYFIESENNPEKDPLLLWTSGGPYCSAATALFYEIGPVQFLQSKFDGTFPILVPNLHSWTKVANIIFMDSPVGAGFSYATTPSATHTGDLKSAIHANEFLRKWLMEHPKFLSNPVYLGGDSYVGVTLPHFFLEMSEGNEKGMKPYINLKGYMLGNPFVDFYHYDGDFKVPFAHRMGLISDELYESLKRNCNGRYKTVDQSSNNDACQEDLQVYDKLTNGIHTEMILEAKCPVDARLPYYGPVGGWRSLLNEDVLDSNVLPTFGDFCRAELHALSRYYMNYDSVREALHIRKGTKGHWMRCPLGVPNNYTRDYRSRVPYHASISAKGYRSLIYSGDHDFGVPFISTHAWIRSLGYPVVDDWRPWWVNGQVGGYTMTYANRMTFATVKGGGHTAIEYRPKECLEMFRRWISEQPL